MRPPPGQSLQGGKSAVLNYVHAVELGKPELIERAVHPELHKIGFSWSEENDAYRTHPMTFDQLVELAATTLSGGYVPADATHTVELFEVLDKTASVKLTAFWGTDYMHLAKREGQWKIIQVLWQSPPGLN